MSRNTPSCAAAAAGTKPGKQPRKPASAGAMALTTDKAQALALAHAASAAAADIGQLTAQRDAHAKALDQALKRINKLKAHIYAQNNLVRALIVFYDRTIIKEAVEAAMLEGRIPPHSFKSYIALGEKLGAGALQDLLLDMPTMRETSAAREASPAAAVGG